MDINHIKQILNLVREHELAEFEIEHDGLRLKIRKDSVGSLVVAPSVAPSAPAPTAVASAPPQAGHSGAAGQAGPVAAGGGDEIELAVVKSPIVGTFYRSAEPGAGSFVEVGTTVKK